MLKKTLITVTAVSMLSGCASGLTSQQKQEYRAMESRGLLVNEKNPEAAAALGLLPGFGSFYVREPGFGVLNLLLWPASILWDPVSGYDGATTINYEATKTRIKTEKEKEVRRIERARESGLMSDVEVARAKRDLEDRYSY